MLEKRNTVKRLKKEKKDNFEMKKYQQLQKINAC